MKLPNENTDQLLAAFADGELEGEQNRQVLKRLSQNPALADRIAEQQALRKAVARAMDDSSMKAPAALRDQIARMSRDTRETITPSPTANRADTGSPVLAVIGRWLPAAIAALFFIGALVALNIAGSRDNGLGNNAVAHANGLIAQGNVLNASLVDQFGNRHFKCSRHIAPIHDADKFPQDLAKLPGALSEYFHEPINPELLDLSGLGYEFDMAGLCILPGKGAVHMIYKSQPGTGHSDMLSLWMRPFEEGSGIEADRLYTTADPQENFPMIVWRHGDMVYYLVGDTYDTVERAFEAIRDHRG
ncbi:MAG: hypothetical protein R3C45_11450 [Phycisphaerales bacterium]